MGEKIVVGPITKGLRTDRLPFVIDNDSFPTLFNAYEWRGRVKRKRGTEVLSQLNRYFNSSSVSYNTGSATISFDVAGNANLITGYSLQTNASIVPGSVSIVGAVGPTTYTDPTKDGYLTPTGTGGANTINYATGAILIPAQASSTATATFKYYPTLPVLGLEDLTLGINNYPGTLAFDETYSYNQLTVSPYPIYDVSFYKNPASGGAYTGYTRKTNSTPTTWNGENYQQFYTVNYQGALWATNGITVPFTTTNIGMQFKPISNITNIVPGPPATAQLTINGHGLSIGDFIFINEVVGMLNANMVSTINFQTGYVIGPAIDANNVNVEFPNATLAGAYVSGGIAQYLTNRSNSTLDCLRWYDGDPTNGSAVTPVLSGLNGWVNFAPPLSKSIFSIDERPAAQYYLVGAKMIVPFKDRLLFIGPVIQDSAHPPIYLQDTVIYSQNGTPYYTASFTGDPSLATTVFDPILVPVNQTATPFSYWEDQTGFGGFISAGIDQPINMSGPNEDVLMLGFSNSQARFVYTGNDIVPFNFYITNSELGSQSTFSTVIFDKGVFTQGSRGIIMSNQTGAVRLDDPIPDQVFEINETDNGAERTCAARNYENEWLYLTYTSDSATSIFPNQSLLYNYREQTWAVINESYTTYGQFRRQTGFTWQTVGLTYPTWDDWQDPWTEGEVNLEQPEVIGGNQQGFIIVKDKGTGETNSLYVQSITGNTITSTNHGLNTNDFIIITGCLGTISQFLNNFMFQITVVDENSFTIATDTLPSGTYYGGGLIQRLYVPLIQTRQFPTAWGLGRKTRIGPQMYLLTKTTNSQIQLLIFLSQDNETGYNDTVIVPDPLSENDGLIYTTVLYTCPESTNLGLTPANVNLQMPTAASQAQIWHRMNTSLIGDTVQLGFTISKDQMLMLIPSVPVVAITGATNAYPCVLTSVANYSAGQLVTISGVEGMTQLNGKTYAVISSTLTTVTINIDSTGFAAYVSGGITTPVSYDNATAEVELHGMILDVSPSQMLV
jgi:Ubiquitin-activating enzyme E1 FCCH domain